MLNLILFPAEGRDPQTKEELLNEWQQGLEFRAYGLGFTCSNKKSVALEEKFLTVQLATHNRFIYVRVI